MLDNRLLRTLRCRNDHRPGVLGHLASAIGDAGANIGDIRTVWVGPEHIVRDVDIVIEDAEGLERVVAALAALENAELIEIIDDIHEFHLDGKLEIRATHPVETIADLRRVYTPGVAEVVKTIEADPDESYHFTMRGKSVAIVTNGTRVLGLGNVGPVASLPVMEGKAALLNQFVGISALPIILKSREPDAIVRTVEEFADGFGAIQLEDIESPACFEVEERLVASLDMPVLHDDQHGTAVAALAAAEKAMSRAGLDLETARVGVVGLGAAGTAISRMVQDVTHHAVLGYDPNPQARDRLRDSGGDLARDLEQLMGEADLVIAVSGQAGSIDTGLIRPGQGVLALTNPTPEILPEAALAAGAAFAADGRSVNNLLGFPGILRAAVDCRASAITRSMYVAAARTIASLAEDNELVPSPLRPDVHRGVARAVAAAAAEAGVARVRVPSDYQQEEHFHTLRA